jgi:hypothetical protein
MVSSAETLGAFNTGFDAAQPHLTSIRVNMTLYLYGSDPLSVTPDPRTVRVMGQPGLSLHK